MSAIEGEDAFAGRSLLGSMLRIALPLTLSSAVRYGVDLSNAYWVGKLGVAALSLVTALGTFMSLSKMFAGLTSAGTSAVVGRMMGEGRRREALRTAQKVTAVALVLGTLVAAGGLALSGVALDVLSFEGARRDAAAVYLYVLLSGLPFAFGMMAMNGVLVGLGRPRASMIASTAAFLVGFVMTPLLLRFVGTGVWGAAIAQIAGDLCGYAIGLRALSAHAGPEAFVPWKKRFQKLHELWPVFRVGAPLTLDAVIHGSVWFGLIALLSRYGGEYVAAQGAGVSRRSTTPTVATRPTVASASWTTRSASRRRFCPRL